MRTWKLLAGAVTIAAAAAGAVALLPASADAKPAYLKVFKDTYCKNDQTSELAKLNCAICHTADSNDGGKGKVKARNAFGQAVQGVMREKKAKFGADVLTDAVKKPSAVEGKTFGDLITDKKPPVAQK